jgi:hypothetical protein
MQYLHDFLNMHTIYGGKMQYLYDNLKMHIVCYSFVDGGASTSATFKPRHTSIN